MEARLAYSPKEAAEMIGGSVSTINRAIYSGELPASKLRDRVLIKRETLLKLLETEKQR